MLLYLALLAVQSDTSFITLPPELAPAAMEALTTLRAPPGEVLDVAYSAPHVVTLVSSPDNRRLLSYFDPASGAEVRSAEVSLERPAAWLRSRTGIDPAGRLWVLYEDRLSEYGADGLRRVIPLPRPIDVIHFVGARRAIVNHASDGTYALLLTDPGSAVRLRVPRVSSVAPLDDSRVIATYADAYELAIVDVRSGEILKLLRMPPSALGYLGGAYTRWRIVGSHMGSDCLLWTQVLLELRRDLLRVDAPEDDAQWHHGMLEAIDICTGELRARIFDRDFEFAGWLTGAVGLRRMDGSLELIHVSIPSRADGNQ